MFIFIEIISSKTTTNIQMLCGWVITGQTYRDKKPYMLTHRQLGITNKVEWHVSGPCEPMQDT